MDVTAPSNSNRSPIGAGPTNPERFWKAAFAGCAPRPLPLASPAEPRRERIVTELRWSAEHSYAVAAFAAREGVSLAALAQAAWALVLSRYGSTDDVVFAAGEGSRRGPRPGIAGERRSDVRLPRRIRVPEDASVRSWLAGVQADRDRLRLLPAARWRDVLDWCGIDGTAIDSRLDVREAGPPSVPAAGEENVSPAPLAIRLETRPTLRVRASAEGARFTEAAAAGLLRHFAAAVNGLAGDPDRKVGDVDLLSADERRRVLVEFNRTARDYPREKTAHALIEDAIDRAPDAVAVTCGTEAFSFADLESRSNRIANRLRAEGVLPDAPVAILLERSLEMAAAVLGVLKAGGAYLPLDPAWPRARIEFILADAGVRVVLAAPALADLASHRGVAVFSVAPGLPEWEASSPERPAPSAGPENLAYVIYTSGSTGEPKGVLVPHRGLVNYLCWSADAYASGSGRGAPVHSPLVFDLTVTSFLTPLVAGESIAMIPDREGVDGLVEALRGAKDWSLVKITPAHLEILAARLTPDEARGCARTFVIGGEALRGETLAFWARHAPDSRFVNEYGPTETVVGCCVEVVTAKTWRPGPVPIGRPIANTRLYVLDPAGRPAPIGVPGELHIGGDGLARGYLNRPEKTAASLVGHALPEEPGDRLYRTGDLARWREDGVLECLGRADDQVKIRGYRIEPGEVECALLRHPAVRQAAVIAVAAPSGGSRLVAYVASEGEYAPRSEELRRFLGASLPEYMVPGVFIDVEELPLTSNGKVDRRALPDPPEERAAGSAGRPPRTDAEKKIAAIWKDVLGLADVGADASFFDLGGHSVLAAKVFARIERELGVRMPLAVLVEAPTIAALAALLGRRDRWENAWSSLVPLQPKGRKPPLYVFHPIGGNVVGYVDLARRLGEDQPLYGLQAVGLDGSRPRQKGVDRMAAHYVREIRAFQPEGPYYLAGSSFGGTLAFAAAHRLRAAGAEVAFLGMFDTWGPDYRRRKDVSARRERWARIRDRVSLHVGNLIAAEGVRGKARYVAAKTARVVQNVVKNARRLRIPRLRPPDLARTLASVERSAVKAKDAWVPRPYSGPITLFRASRQPSWFRPDPKLGWGRLAVGGLEVLEVPGHHGALVHEPRVAVLAEHLTECLARARAESEPESATGTAS